jgi:dihydroorotase
MELLIKGARVVDYCQDFIGDVYIKDGIINEIGTELYKHCNVVNAVGKVLMPAFIDLHSHFRDPGLAYKEDISSGSRAAVKGGYTTVNLMANTKPVCSGMDTVSYVMEKAKKEKLVDISQTVSITRNLEGKDLSHLDGLNKENMEVIKFISDDGKGVGDSKIMLQAMVKAKEKGLTLISHAESPELSSVDMRLAENIMTWRDISLAKVTGCRLHMAHVSTKEAMEYVIDGKKSEVKVTCEVTPHHLALTEEVNYKVNPPLRNKEDIEYLIKAIGAGYVDIIATDHAPHSKEDKEMGAPGISGLETAFSVCYTALVKSRKISLNKLSELMSKNPAEIMEINKGKITIGYEGDLVLIDIDKKYKIDSQSFVSKGKNTPFEGITVYGEIVNTIKGGRLVYSR